MADLFTLGDLFISDFLAPGEEPRGEPQELRLVMDDDGLVHLASQPAPELMWGRYWYRSATSATMRAELADLVASVEQVVEVGEGDVWVDVACNDGTLLGYVDTPPVLDVPGGMLGRVRVGVDPADDSFANAARAVTDLHLQEPFTQDSADAILAKYKPAAVVTCAAMFYDLMDPSDFLAAAHRLLDRNGLLVLQLSYSPLMLRQVAFDNICHEHARYYTLTTLRSVLSAAGFQVADVELNDVNGGSMRVYALRDDADPDAFATQPRRDVGAHRVESLASYEDAQQVNTPEPWLAFWRSACLLREHAIQFVRDVTLSGKLIYGLGASTKANTLWQWFGFGPSEVQAIGERQEQKVGLRCVGSDIPIISEEAMRGAEPDYLWVGPWHFRSEIVAREAAYLAGGGRLLFPMPTFEWVPG